MTLVRIDGRYNFFGFFTLCLSDQARLGNLGFFLECGASSLPSLAGARASPRPGQWHRKLQQRAQPRKARKFLRSLAKECKHFSSVFDAAAWPYGPKTGAAAMQMKKSRVFGKPVHRLVDTLPKPSTPSTRTKNDYENILKGTPAAAAAP